MPKKHVSQNEKQKFGKYYTTNAAFLLEGFESLVKDKSCVDPFCGDRDLLRWAEINGAISTEGYDLHPQHPETEKRNSFENPPSLDGKFVLSNPPYLAAAKNADKSIYEKYEINDLYKAFLLQLIDTSVTEGILIIPSNFLSESSSRARDPFLSSFEILECRYFQYPAFPEATTGVIVFSFKRSAPSDSRKFFMEMLSSPTESEKFEIEIWKKYKWLWGDRFFDFIDDPRPLKIKLHTTESRFPPNTRLVLGLLDKGKYKFGCHVNEGEPFVTPPNVFTTYQVDIPEIELTLEQERRVAAKYNEILWNFRREYRGMFLSNYMGGIQKIKSRAMAHALLSKVIKEELRIPTTRDFIIF